MALEDYANIVKIEITKADGSAVYLEGEEAQVWAEAVDWGLRRKYAEEIQKYGKTKTAAKFNWRGK